MKTFVVSGLIVSMILVQSCGDAADKTSENKTASILGSLTKRGINDYVTQLDEVLRTLSDDRTWLTADVLKQMDQSCVRLSELNIRLPITSLSLKEDDGLVDYDLVIESYIPKHLEESVSKSIMDYRVALDPDRFYWMKGVNEMTNGVPDIRMVSYMSKKEQLEVSKEEFVFNKKNDALLNEPIFFIDLKESSSFSQNPLHKSLQQAAVGTYICLAAFTLKYSQESGNEEVEIYESDGPNPFSNPFNSSTPWILDGQTRTDALLRSRVFWDVDRVDHGRYGNPDDPNGWIALRNLSTGINYRLHVIEDDITIGSARFNSSNTSPGAQTRYETVRNYDMGTNTVIDNVYSAFQFLRTTDSNPDDIHVETGVQNINIDNLNNRVVANGNGQYFDTDKSPGNDLGHCNYYFARLIIN